MNNSILRKLQLFWAYFIGMGAMAGTVMMLIDPSGVMWGMDSLLPILKEGLPMFGGMFNNFVMSSIVLFVVVGLPNAISAILIHRRSRLSSISGIACGIILMLWIILEFYIWGFATASVIYFIFAILQLLTSLKSMYSVKTADN